MKIKFHYAWIIILITFLTFLTVQGIRLSFGAFIEPWENEFSLDRGTISLISTLSFIVYGISQPIIGRLVDKLGARIILSFSTLLVGISIVLISFVNQPWQLFFLYGVVVSIGVGGTSNVAASVIVTNWFNKKRGLAFGIIEAGFGAGQMLLVPGSLLLIDMLSWKATVIIQGVLLVILIFPITLLFLRNHPMELGLKPIGENIIDTSKEDTKNIEKTFSIWQVFLKKEFWFLILPFGICGFTTTGLMDTHLIPFAQLCGFSTSTTSFAISILAAFNIIGILLSGIVADIWSSRKFLIVLYTSRALSLFILIFSSDPYLFIIFAAIFGLVDFATVAPTQLLATQYFKDYSIGFILGWLFLSHQIGSALGAYLPGLFYNMTGSYINSFYLSIILLGIAAFLNFLLPEPFKASLKEIKLK
ncbi:MFS transporter, partial [Lysinibacillus telephonicus]